MNLSEASNWLSSNLEVTTPNAQQFWIYGSVASHKDSPQDCDLLVVSSEDVKSSEWQATRSLIEKAKPKFLKHFQVELNHCMLTEGEYYQFKEFFSPKAKIES